VASSAPPALLAVDGGGTKTEFVLISPDGNLLHRLVLSGSNPNSVSREGSFRILCQGIDRMLQLDYSILSIFIGCAGMAAGGNGEAITDSLRKQYPGIKLCCSSDICNIIACAKDSDNAIAVICGTGSVIYANENRNIHRLGGASYFLDTQGSGFHIGRDVLRVALLERDGIGEKSAITALVEQQLGSTVWDSIHQIYQEGPTYIASFAPIAFAAYAQGDKAAEKILREHAGYFAKMLGTAAKMYDCGKTVVLSGSIFTNAPVFLEMLKEQMTEDLQFEVPSQPPVYGACRLACELCGIDSAPFAKYFEEQYAELK
jgi:N-acetylglucosamine kinase-like BadF-type ATPase